MKVTQQEIDNIKITLKSLPQIKQKEIIDFVMASKLGSSKATSNRNHELFYNALAQEIKNRINYEYAGYAIFVNKPYYKQFKDGVDSSDAFLKEAKVGTLNLSTRAAFYKIFASILCDRAMELDLPVNFKILTKH